MMNRSEGTSMASTAFGFPSTLMAIHFQVNSSTTLSVRTFLPSRAVLDEVVGPDEIGVSSRTIFILALAAAGENDPFILVAHSLGDPSWPKFGDQVAGLVFVDATHPDRVARFSEVAPNWGDPRVPDYPCARRVEERHKT
jgi:hypothetical protein